MFGWYSAGVLQDGRKCSRCLRTETVEKYFTHYWSKQQKNNWLQIFLATAALLFSIEMLGRKCYAMEIDPVFAELSIRRLEHYRNRKTAAVNSPFPELNDLRFLINDFMIWDFKSCCLSILKNWLAELHQRAKALHQLMIECWFAEWVYGKKAKGERGDCHSTDEVIIQVLVRTSERTTISGTNGSEHLTISLYLSCEVLPELWYQSSRKSEKKFQSTELANAMLQLQQRVVII